MSKALDIAGILICFVAGLYLLQSQTADSSSYLEVIGRGMGGYFVAKSIWMARSLHLQVEQLDAQRKLVEWAAFEHEERSASS